MIAEKGGIAVVFNIKMLEVFATAGASIVTGIIGIIFGNYQQKHEYESKVHNQQLEKAYSPIVSVLMAHDCQLTVSSIQEIDAIMCEQNALIAPSVISAWLKYKHDKSPDAAERFKSALMSNYNWVKKCLEHPYIEAKIHMEDIPIHHWGQRQAIRAVVAASFVLLGCIAAYTYLKNPYFRTMAFLLAHLDVPFMLYWIADLIGKAGRK